MGLLCLLRGTLTHSECREAQRRTDGGNLRRFDQAPRQVATLQVLHAHGERFVLCLVLSLSLARSLNYLFSFQLGLPVLIKERNKSSHSSFLPSFLFRLRVPEVALPSAVAPHPDSISHPQLENKPDRQV